MVFFTRLIMCRRRGNGTASVMNAVVVLADLEVSQRQQLQMGWWADAFVFACSNWYTTELPVPECTRGKYLCGRYSIQSYFPEQNV
jgi:hypothetical protein